MVGAVPSAYTLSAISNRVHNDTGTTRVHTRTHTCFRLPTRSACTRGHPHHNFASTTFSRLARSISHVYQQLFHVTPGRNRTDRYALLIEAQLGVSLYLIALTSALSLGGFVWSQAHRHYVRFKKTLTYTLSSTPFKVGVRNPY